MANKRSYSDYTEQEKKLFTRWHAAKKAGLVNNSVLTDLTQRPLSQGEINVAISILQDEGY